MDNLNFNAAWIGIALGCISGALIGLKFHRSDWAGGYTSWRRRMMRLGHISFFGIALINVAFAMGVRLYGVEMSSPLASYLLVIGAVTMPLICFLSAWRTPFRSLFGIPVLSLATAAVLFVNQSVITVRDAVVIELGMLL